LWQDSRGADSLSHFQPQAPMSVIDDIFASVFGINLMHEWFWYQHQIPEGGGDNTCSGDDDDGDGDDNDGRDSIDGCLGLLSPSKL